MGRAGFSSLMNSDPSAVPLDEASLAISATLQPGLDEFEWLAAIDLLAGECPTPTAEGVARHLFDSLGFRGNTGEYYDWRNSCLDRVIATRTGIPITLSVLMIEVARRVGVECVGVGMPAHFLVGVAGDEDTFFDPFHGGVRLDLAGVRSLFVNLTGNAPWSDSYVAPTSNRDIVIRMLNNLKVVFASERDAVRMAMVMQLRAELPELAAQESDEIAAAAAVFN